MRKINVRNVQKAIEKLCLRANIELRPDILSALKKAFGAEKNKKAKMILKALVENAKIARKQKLAICQDTGMVVVYLDIGENAKIIGGSLKKAVNKGIKNSYRKGCFRKSVVKDPLSRINTKDNTPCVLYTRFTKGSRVSVTVSIRGFGSENRSRIEMFKPTATTNEVKDFILEAIKDTGPDACPPFIVGIGIGGTFEKAASLAKEATLRPIEKKNPIRPLAMLEKEILKDINKTKIGPMGLGGKTTALAVNISSYPTHIAGMPVAVSIGCHATRSAKCVI